jgi:hypothetical protein
VNSVPPLRAAALAAIDCLAVAATDRVLVLSNTPQRRIAEALVEAACMRTGTVRLLEFPTLSRHGEEPPESVTRACDEATVVLAATVYSLSHTQTRMRATGRGARLPASRPRAVDRVRGGGLAAHDAYFHSRWWVSNASHQAS